MPVTAPGRSSSPGCDSDSLRKRGASSAATTPIGKLIRKVRRQPSMTTPKISGDVPVSQPPRIRPTAAPAPDIAAYTANARLRAGPAGNVVVISARAAGEASAAPRPCRPRAPSRSGSLVREAAEQRRHGEDDQADHEDPPAAVEVAEAAAEQQQAAEGQRVAGDDPGQVGLRDVEVGLDVGQRDVGDGGVQDHHQLRDRDEDEGPAEVELALRAGLQPARRPGSVLSRCVTSLPSVWSGSGVCGLSAGAARPHAAGREDDLVDEGRDGLLGRGLAEHEGPVQDHARQSGRHQVDVDVRVGSRRGPGPARRPCGRWRPWGR